MKRYIGIIGTICLVLTLCLAAIGVGYGHWTESLNIDGQVQTGEFGVEYLNAVASDNDGAGNGETSVTLKDEDGDGDTEWMYVVLEDGYYSYVGKVNFDIHNHGSVAAEISEITITENLNPNSLEVVLSGIAVGDIIDAGASIPCELTVEVITEATGVAGVDVKIEAVNWNADGGGV